jgi:hypothetical protein
VVSGCNGLIHVPFGWVLEDDEGSFKADSVVCPRCVQVGQKSRKRKNPPKPTARKSEGDRNERVKIKIRRTVKIPHSQLYHILTTDEQHKMILKDIPNTFPFFGTVVSHGKNKSSWNAKWDVLSESDNVIHNIS